MAHNAPGRHYREGITLMQLADMFPDEAAARTWFEGLVWPNGRYCPRCGSTKTHEASHAMRQISLSLHGLPVLFFG